MGPASAAGPGPGEGPLIDVWFGDSQTFGVPGDAQLQVNVLGNVSDPDGVAWLSWSLNGGPERGLNVGPDTRRLWSPGDFNVELFTAELAVGANAVLLRAQDGLGNQSERTVTVDYQPGTWPGSWTADWDAAASIDELAQVVDGEWALVPGGIRPTALGYDRTFAIGDVSWTDFEATVPITIHGLDPNGWVFPSVAPGVGFTNRWTGHTLRVAGEQPLTDWHPQGGNAWYDFGGDRLFLGGGDGLFVVDQSDWTPSFEVTYLWKLRAETLPTGDTFYGLKVWTQGQPEPDAYVLSGSEGPADLQSGSLLVIAHHVDATFGTIEVQELATETTAPLALDVAVQPGPTGATISWRTDEPATSRLAFGASAAYELGLAGSTDLGLQHSVSLTGLASGTTHHFELRSADGRGNLVAPTDRSFTTEALDPPPPSSVVSDDFSGPGLDAGTWTLVDPLGDSSAWTENALLAIRPGSAATHDLWTGAQNAPRVLQDVLDEDFEVEARFESGFHGGFRSRGIVVEQDADDLLRVELHDTGAGPRLFAASFVNDAPTIRANESVALGNPSWLRLRRTGDSWKVSYSSDGTSWTVGATFTHAMSPARIGPFAGNGAGIEHTALVDFFFNNAAPIAPEDGGERTVTVECLGGGAVLRSPDLATFASGASVQLDALPPLGGSFAGWGGDLAAHGATNPLTIQVDADVVATATFTAQQDTTPPQISAVQVVPSETGATVTWTTDEPADSAVEHGPTAAYELGAVSDAALVTQHSLELVGLSAATEYHLRVASADGSGNATLGVDTTFTTDGPQPDLSGIVSSDFSETGLDPAVWTVLDPLGDGAVVHTGTQLQLVLPGTATHDAWLGTNDTLRVVQPTQDADLAIEARFETAPTQSFQSQGLLVEQDATNYLRVELHRYSGATRLFVAQFAGGQATIRANAPLQSGDPPAAQPLWLRVTRVGDDWTVAYSLDGAAWIAGASFHHVMVATSVGAYAGNGGGAANTVTLDWFANVAAPPLAEDADPSALVLNVVGQGTVARTPFALFHDAGELVDLLAASAPGWRFDGWQGDVASDDHALSVLLGDPTALSAVFVPDAAPPVLSELFLSRSNTLARLTWTTDEPATGRVDIGLTEAYGASFEQPGRSADHDVLVSGLAPHTTYHYRVVSVDEAGNEGSSGDLLLRTGPRRTGIRVPLRELASGPAAH